MKSKLKLIYDGDEYSIWEFNTTSRKLVIRFPSGTWSSLVTRPISIDGQTFLADEANIFREELKQLPETAIKDV